MTKIKFCGLRKPEDIETANALQVDYVGFVFYPQSSRYILPETAEKLRKKLKPDILAVGVFVNEEIPVVAELLNRGIIDIAQLHGTEDESYIRKVQEMTGKTVVKAFRMESEEDQKAAEGCSADYILLDSGNGGTGKTFDWNLIENIRRPFFLAGGLNPENIRQAVETMHPYAVDVSSGIETKGQKDREKMKQFVTEIRSADRKKEEDTL